MGELAEYLTQNDPNFRKARLPALYSDFRAQRTLNPDGYQANVAAWRHALSHLAAHGLLSKHSIESTPFVVKVDAALPRLLESRQFGQPLALGTAVREAVSDRELLPLQSFLSAQGSVYTKGWGELPWAVVGWTLRLLGVVDPARGEDKLPTGKYVVMGNLEAAAREFAARMADHTSVFERVFTRRQFEQVFAAELVSGQRLAETDLDVLLRFLSRDKAMVQYNGQTVRIRGAADDDAPITEQDTTIASIKELTASLKHQIHLLETRIEELDKTSKAAVARKNRISALAALKSKKIAESSLSTRYSTLNQLEAVADKIEQAADQVALVKVMESSAGVLAHLNKVVGGAERVDGVMDKLREQMADTDEVAAILAEPGSGVQDVDEAEIDDELKALERQEREKEEESARKKAEAEAKQRLEELPSVPTDQVPSREKDMSPTRETGIANLSMEDKEPELSQPVPN